MSKKAPVYVRFFPSDWLAGTRGLTMYETGVYITLVAMMYERGEALDADYNRLARLCGVSSPLNFSTAMRSLIESGKIVETEDGKLFNGKVGIELQRSINYRTQQARTAQSRWDKKDNVSNKTRMPSHLKTDARVRATPVPEPYQEKEDTDVSSKKSANGTRIPDDFQPDIDAAISEGVPPLKARNEAKRFVDYWLAKAGREATKRDWPATWRVWYRRDLVPRQQGQGPPVEKLRTRSRSAADSALEELQDDADDDDSNSLFPSQSDPQGNFEGARYAAFASNKTDRNR